MPEMVDDYTAAMLEREGKKITDLETEIVQAPFVQVIHFISIITIFRYLPYLPAIVMTSVAASMVCVRR